MNTIYFLLNDRVWFSLLELLLIGFYIFALIKQSYYRFKRGISAEVIRGDMSWEYFFITWAILSMILSTVISSTNILVGYKTLIIIIDLWILFYLVFINGWFRNKIVGFWAWFKKLPEK